MVQEIYAFPQEALVQHPPNNATYEPPTPAETITASTQVTNYITASNTIQQHMLQQMQSMMQTMKMKHTRGEGRGGGERGG